MAAQSYDESLRRLLISEGGYTNHPADPGGPTNFGITIADYRKYTKPNATAADVKAMKVEEAKAIYKVKYWAAQRCDELPAGVDYAIFDYGVNSGIGRSGKVLRRSLRMADDTSAISDGVIAAANSVNVPALIAAICDERLRFLKSLKTWPVFGGGWGRRVAEVKLAALAMSQNQKPIEPTLAPGKGAVPVNKTIQQGSVGTAVVAATGASHISGYSSSIVSIAIAVAILSVVIAVVVTTHNQTKQQEAAV